MSLGEILYEHSPIFIQNALCSLYGDKISKLRYSKRFFNLVEWLMESEKWNETHIEAYQNEQLKKLINHAYHSVPYYKQTMQKLKLTPKDIQTKEDLPKLPLLTKEDVRNNRDLFIANNIRKNDLIFSHTSGTTGKSLEFYLEKDNIAFRWAVWWRHRKRFNVEINAPHANFTGKIVIPIKQNRPPYWRFNKPMNQTIFTMHHIQRDKIDAITSYLGNNDFIYYSGYPSIIHALSLCALENGLTLNKKPKFVFTGAENILEFQKKDIADFTNATITDQYGFSEGCGNASHCSEFVYHEDFEFGIMECIDPESLADGRIKGRIVCTGLSNFAFPFIRYDIGDVAIWEDSHKKCNCGRHSKVIISIDGRIDDYVLTPEGRRIMRFDYIFKDTHTVKECQIVQKKQGEIIARIVRWPNYSQKDELYIKSEVSRWISPKLTIVFEYVPYIEKERNGKFRAVKSFLKQI